jgi:hypothetical protein
LERDQHEPVAIVGMGKTTTLGGILVRNCKRTKSLR